MPGGHCLSCLNLRSCLDFCSIFLSVVDEAVVVAVEKNEAVVVAAFDDGAIVFVDVDGEAAVNEFDGSVVDAIVEGVVRFDLVSMLFRLML